MLRTYKIALFVDLILQSLFCVVFRVVSERAAWRFYRLQGRDKDLNLARRYGFLIAHRKCAPLHLFRRALVLRVVKMSETIAHAIPADILADKDKAYKVSQKAKKTLLADTDELYMQSWKQKFKAAFPSSSGSKEAPLQIAKQYDLEVGAVRGKETLEFPIDPLKSVERTAEVFDDRVPQSRRGRNMKEGKTALHLGALEVAVDGIAAMSSDLYMGAMLVDTRHQNPENAFRGAMVAQINDQQNRAVFYPSTRLHLATTDRTDKMKLVVVCPNNDMGDNDTCAVVRVSTVAEVNDGFHQDHQTKLLVKRSAEEQAHAVAYARNNCITVNPRTFTEFNPSICIKGLGGIKVDRTGPLAFVTRKLEPMCFSINAGRDDIVAGWNHGTVEPSAPYFTSGSAYGRNELGQNSEGSTANLQQLPGFDNLHVAHEPVTYIDPVRQLGSLSASQRILVSGRFKIGKNVVEGTVLHMESCTAWFNSQFGSLLRLIDELDGTLQVEIECAVTSLSGVGLIAGLYEGDRLRETDRLVRTKQLFTCQGVNWNPACDNKVVMEFSPMAGLLKWNAEALSSKGCYFVVCATGPWFNPPNGDIWANFRIRVNPGGQRLPLVRPLERTSKCSAKRHFGKFALKQGDEPGFIRVPMVAGMVSLAKGKVMHSMSSNLMALWGFVKANIVCELVRTSSPMMNCTLALALLPASLAFSLSPSQLLEFPHVSCCLREMSSRVVVKIPAKAMGLALPTNLGRFGGGWTKENASHYLVVWVKDSISSTVVGDLCLDINVLELQDVERMGSPCSMSFRSEGQNSDMIGSPAFSPYFKVTNLDADSPMTCKLDLLTARLSFDEPSASWMQSFSPLSSPLLRILQQAPWVRGGLRFKFVWLSKPLPYKELSSAGVITYHPYGPACDPVEIHAFSGPSGACEFSVQLEGPIFGFAADAPPSGYVGNPTLVIQCGTLKTIQNISLFLGIEQDFSIAGTGFPIWEAMTSVVADFNI